MGVYAFADVVAGIAGPGGAFPLGAGAGIAEEGIEIDQAGDKNTMTIGADGTGQHNLHADRSGTLTVRLLKSSPTNKLLSDLYAFQTVSAAFHGQNVISIANPVTGDTITASQCAFKKFPRNAYSKDGPVLEWTFDAVAITTRLGARGPVF